MLDFRNELEDDPGGVPARTTSAPRRSRPTRTCSTTRTARSGSFDVLREDEVEAGVQALLASRETSGPRRGLRGLDPALATLRRARRGGAGRVPRRARPLRRTSTRSSPRSSPYVDRALERDYLYGRALAAYAARPGGRAARPRQRGRADAPPDRADLRGLGLARGGRGRGRRDLLRPREGARARAGAPLADRRGHQRALRARARRGRPAPLRPVRGDVGGGRDARGPGPRRTPSRTSGSSSTARS